MYTQELKTQIEVVDSGLQILARLIVRDPLGNKIATRNHRTSIPFDSGDVEAQMAAVNADIQSMGWPAIEPVDIARIKAHYDLAKRML